MTINTFPLEYRPSRIFFTSLKTERMETPRKLATSVDYTHSNRADEVAFDKTLDTSKPASNNIQCTQLLARLNQRAKAGLNGRLSKHLLELDRSRLKHALP